MTVSDMISDVITFEAKMNIFSLHLKRKKLLHLLSMQSGLNDNASASGALDRAAEKYSQLLIGLGQDFEDRFCDFDKLEPYVSFISNSFMQVDMTCIAEQLRAPFSLDVGEVEMEILSLQSDLHLKAIRAHQTLGALCIKKSTKSGCTATMKVFLIQLVCVSQPF